MIHGRVVLRKAFLVLYITLACVVILQVLLVMGGTFIR